MGELSALLRSLALAVYAPSFLVAISLNGITILLPLYVLELGGSAAFAGMVIGLRGLGSMLASVPAGLAISRFGDTRVVLAGMLLLVVVVSTLAYTDTVVFLAPLGFLFGVGTGMWQLGRLNYVTEATTLADRGRAVSVMAGLQRGGFIIGPALGGVMAQLYGFESFFLLCAGLYCLTALLVVRFARAGRGSVKAHSASARLLHTARQSGDILLRAGVPVICLQLLRATRTLILPLWGAFIGLSPSEIGLAFSIASTVDMLMFYPAGWMIDHLGRRVVLAPAMALMASSTLLLGLSGSLFGFSVLCFLSGLGNGFSTGIAMTLGGDFAPDNARGEFLGLWRLVGDVGTASGPFVVGGLVGAFGLVPAGLVIGMIGLGGCALVFLVMPETRSRK